MPKSRLRSAKEDALTEVESKLLLTACLDLLDNLVVRLPLYAGLRIGEAQHLKKSWLDWDKGIAVIPARQQCQCYECRKWRNNIWTPKTKAAQRSLLIVPELGLYLSQVDDGVNRSRQALEQRFERIRQRSGLMKVAYPHCLRASFATRLAEQGISAPSLTYLLGWETLAPAEHYIQSTMKRAHAEMKELIVKYR
ncbi:tyrosine-type recombinase/integrase [Chloroflexota bacterium]